MAKITHKIRNPKQLSKWLDIWTADVTSGTSYIITPSNKWQIPVSQIINTTSSKNVDTPGGTSGALAKFSDDNTITNGPVINTNGATDKFLNEKGQWVNITYKINLEEETELAVQYVGTSPSVVGYSGKISLQQLINNTILTSQDIRLSSDLPIKLNVDPDQDNIQFSLEKLTNSDIADNANIAGSKIADNSITSNKLVSNISIPGNNIALNSWGSRGVVEKGQGHANSFWGTGADSVPGWQSFDIEELDYSIRSKINTIQQNGMVLKSNGASNKVWGTDNEGNPNWYRAYVQDYDLQYELIPVKINALSEITDSQLRETSLNSNDYKLFLEPIEVLSSNTIVQSSPVNYKWDDREIILKAN